MNCAWSPAREAGLGRPGRDPSRMPPAGHPQIRNRIYNGARPSIETQRTSSTIDKAYRQARCALGWGPLKGETST